MEILAAYCLTGSYRDAAALVGCSHHAVTRYLLSDPEYDEPQASGELTFFIMKQAWTGKSGVTVRFSAYPEILDSFSDAPR